VGTGFPTRSTTKQKLEPFRDSFKNGTALEIAGDLFEFEQKTHLLLHMPAARGLQPEFVIANPPVWPSLQSCARAANELACAFAPWPSPSA